MANIYIDIKKPHIQYECGYCGEHKSNTLVIDVSSIKDEASFIVCLFKNGYDETKASQRFYDIENNTISVPLVQELTQTGKESMIVEAYAETDGEISFLRKSSVIKLVFGDSIHDTETNFDDNVTGLYAELLELEERFNEDIENLSNYKTTLDETVTNITELTNEVQRKLDDGEFKGEKGDKGEKGEPGESGVQDYWQMQRIPRAPLNEEGLAEIRINEIPNGRYDVVNEFVLKGTSRRPTPTPTLVVGTSSSLYKNDIGTLIINSGNDENFPSAWYIDYTQYGERKWSEYYQVTRADLMDTLLDYAFKDDIPTKTSELENDSNFATEQYVEQEIANFDFIKIVTELPATGLPNRTYFVAKTDTKDNDLYDEYMWVNNAWEFVGTKTIDVDLTDYVKTTTYPKWETGQSYQTAGVVRAGNGIDYKNGLPSADTIKKENWNNWSSVLVIGKGTLENLKTKSTDSFDDADDVSFPTSLKVKNELANKADVTTKDIDLESASANITITDNKTFKRGTLSSLTIELPTLTVNDDYLATLLFKSGASATSLNYPYDTKWIGDDLSNGKFAPVANKSYDLFFNWNGDFWTAIVNGKEATV